MVQSEEVLHLYEIWYLYLDRVKGCNKYNRLKVKVFRKDNTREINLKTIYYNISTHVIEVLHSWFTNFFY